MDSGTLDVTSGYAGGSSEHQGVFQPNCIVEISQSVIYMGFACAAWAANDETTRRGRGKSDQRSYTMIN
jgi:hypothetical protein